MVVTTFTFVSTDARWGGGATTVVTVTFVGVPPVVGTRVVTGGCRLLVSVVV